MNKIKNNKGMFANIFHKLHAKKKESAVKKDRLGFEKTSKKESKVRSFNAPKIIAYPLNLMNSIYDKFDHAFLKLLDKLGLTNKFGKISRANTAWRVVPLIILIAVSGFIIVGLISSVNAGSRETPISKGSSYGPAMCKNETYRTQYKEICGSKTENKLAKFALPTIGQAFNFKLVKKNGTDFKNGVVKSLDQHNGVLHRGPSKGANVGAAPEQRYGIKIGSVKGEDTTGGTGDTDDEEEEEDEEVKPEDDDEDTPSKGVHISVDRVKKTVGLTYDIKGNDKEKFDTFTWFDSGDSGWQGEGGSSYISSPPTGTIKTNRKSEPNMGYTAQELRLTFINYEPTTEKKERLQDKWDEVFGGFVFSGGTYTRARIQNVNSGARYIGKIYNYGDRPLYIEGNEMEIGEIINLGGGIVYLSDEVTVDKVTMDSGKVIVGAGARVEDATVTGGQLIFAGSYDATTGNINSAILVDGSVTGTGQIIFQDNAEVLGDLKASNSGTIKIKGQRTTIGQVRTNEDGSPAIDEKITIEGGEKSGKLYTVGTPLINSNLVFNNNPKVYSMGGCFKDTAKITESNSSSDINYGYKYKYIFPGFDKYTKEFEEPHGYMTTGENGLPVVTAKAKYNTACIFLKVSVDADEQYTVTNNVRQMEGIRIQGGAYIDENNKTVTIDGFTLPSDVTNSFKLVYTSNKVDMLTFEGGETNTGSTENTLTAPLFNYGNNPNIRSYTKPGIVDLGWQIQVCGEDGECENITPSPVTDDSGVNYYYNGTIKVHILDVNVYEFDYSKNTSTQQTSIFYRRDDLASSTIGRDIVMESMKTGTINAIPFSGAAALTEAAKADKRIDIYVESRYYPEKTGDQLSLGDNCGPNQPNIDNTTEYYYATTWRTGLAIYAYDPATTPDTTLMPKQGQEIGFLDNYAPGKDSGFTETLSVAAYLPRDLAAATQNKSDQRTVAIINGSGKDVIWSSGYSLLMNVSNATGGNQLQNFILIKVDKLNDLGIAYSKGKGGVIDEIYDNSVQGGGSLLEEYEYRGYENGIIPASFCYTSVTVNIKAKFENTVLFGNDKGSISVSAKSGTEYSLEYWIQGFAYAGSGKDFEYDEDGLPGVKSDNALAVQPDAPETEVEKDNHIVTKEGKKAVIPEPSDALRNGKGEYEMDLVVVVGGGKAYVAYECGDINVGHINESAEGLIQQKDALGDPTGDYLQEFNITPGTAEQKNMIANACVTDSDKYELIGWSLTRGGSKVFEPSELISFPHPKPNLTYGPNQKMSAIAVWKKHDGKKFDLKLSGDIGVHDIRITDSSNETKNWSGTYEEGEKLTVELTLEKGYNFGGWDSGEGEQWPNYLHQDATNPHKFTMTMPNYAVELEAVTNQTKPYYIKYDCNGGNGKMSDQKVFYSVDAELLSPSSCWRSGYEFGGWSDEQKDTRSQISADAKIYTDGQPIRDLGDITLYAVWDPCAEGDNTCTSPSLGSGKLRVVAGFGIESVSVDGTLATGEIPSTPGSVHTITYTVKRGYEFAGWGTSIGALPDAEGRITIPEGNDGLIVYVYASIPTKLFAIYYNTQSDWFSPDPDEKEEEELTPIGDQEEGDDTDEENVVEQLCRVSKQVTAFYQKNYLRSTRCADILIDDDDDYIYVHIGWSKERTNPDTAKVEDVDFFPGDKVIQPNDFTTDTEVKKTVLYAVWTKVHITEDMHYVDVKKDPSSRCITGLRTDNATGYYLPNQTVGLIYTATPECTVNFYADDPKDLEINHETNQFTMPDQDVKIVAYSGKLATITVCYYPNNGDASDEEEYKDCKVNQVVPMFSLDSTSLLGSIFKKTIDGVIYTSVSWVKEEDKSKPVTDTSIKTYADGTLVSSITSVDTKDGDTINLYAWWDCDNPNVCVIKPTTVLLKKHESIEDAWIKKDGTRFPAANEVFPKMGKGVEFDTGADVIFGGTWMNYKIDPIWNIEPSSVEKTKKGERSGTTELTEEYTFKKPAEAVLINQYTNDKVFTLKYSCNGGNVNGSLPDQKGYYSDEIRLYDSSKCSRTGYEFNGWDRGTSAEKGEFSAGQTVTFSSIFTLTEDTTEKTLNAIWKKTGPGEIKCDDGTIVNDISECPKPSGKYSVTVLLGTGVKSVRTSAFTTVENGASIDLEDGKIPSGSYVVLDFELSEGYQYISPSSVKSNEVSLTKKSDTSYAFTMPEKDVTVGEVTAGIDHCTTPEGCYEVVLNAENGVAEVKIGSDDPGKLVSAKYNEKTPVSVSYVLESGFGLDKYTVEPASLVLSGDGLTKTFKMPASNVKIAFYGKSTKPGGTDPQCVGNICVVCDENGNCEVCIGEYCVKCEYNECIKCLTGTCEICDDEGNCIVCDNYICRYCDKDNSCVVCVGGTCIPCTGESCKCPETGTCEIVDPVNPKKKIVCKDYVCMVCDDNGVCKVCVGGMCVKCTETECLKCVLEGECQICDDEGNCIYCSGGICTICDRYGNCKSCVKGVCTVCNRDNCPNVPKTTPGTPGSPGSGYITDPDENSLLSSIIPFTLILGITAGSIYLVYYYRYKKKGIKIESIFNTRWWSK